MSDDRKYIISDHPQQRSESFTRAKNAINNENGKYFDAGNQCVSYYPMEREESFDFKRDACISDCESYDEQNHDHENS